MRRVQKAIAEYKLWVQAIRIRANRESGMYALLLEKINNALTEANSARSDLARILDSEREPTVWEKFLGDRVKKLFEDYKNDRGLSRGGDRPAPGTSLLRTAGPLLPTFDLGTEFDVSTEYLRWRITSDVDSRKWSNLDGAASWEEKAKALYRLVADGGEWDLKEDFDTLFGMADRNSLYTPLPMELGDIHGRQGEIDRDFLGNIHYGYMVSSLNYYTRGAFVAWVLDFENGVGDPGDAIGVRIGRELYEKYPPGVLTPERHADFERDLREAIRRNYAELVSVGKIRVR